MKKRTYVLLFIVIALVWFFNSTSGEYGRKYSPDNQYSVYSSSYHSNIFRMAMPGQGGDQKGKLFLYDEIEKKVIATGEIVMISLTGDIQWEKNSAYYIGDDYPNSLNYWELPREIKFPFRVNYPNNITKMFRPDSSTVLWESRKENVLGLNLEVYKCDFNNKNEITLETFTEYFPELKKVDTIKEGTNLLELIPRVITQKLCRNGVLTNFQKTKGYYNSSNCECGVSISYSQNGDIISKINYEDCYNKNFECKE